MYKKPMKLDKRPVDDFQIHPNAADNMDVFGLELELEGENIKSQKSSIHTFWGVHEDHSLRPNIKGRGTPDMGQAIEYVSRAPFDRKTSIESLTNLFTFLNTKPAIVFPSYRTSLHVHVNCAMETWRTVYNYIALSIIFDELFTSLNGDHRIGNNFCLRYMDAEASISSMVEAIDSFGNLYEFPHNFRYNSVNVASLKKFGTLEFRSMECTTDLERVVHWMDTLQRMKESAREFQNPVDIIGLFSRYSPSEFGKRILGDYWDKYHKVPDHQAMLNRGMRLAQDFAYCAAWQNAKPRNPGDAAVEVDEEQPKPEAKKKTYDEMIAEQIAQAQIAAHQLHQQAQGAGQPVQQPMYNIHNYGNEWDFAPKPIKPKPKPKPKAKIVTIAPAQPVPEPLVKWPVIDWN